MNISAKTIPGSTSKTSPMTIAGPMRRVAPKYFQNGMYAKAKRTRRYPAHRVRSESRRANVEDVAKTEVERRNDRRVLVRVT